MLTKDFSLSRKQLTLANIKIPVKSGNPYRNAGTGKFGFELPGVQFITGRRFIQGMQTETKNALADRVRYTNATEIGIKQNEETGELTVVLFTQGRKMDSFTLPPPNPEDGPEPDADEPEPGTRGEPYEPAFGREDEEQRDLILRAARDLNLNDDQILAQIEESLGRKLSDAEKQQIREEVTRQRIEDLIQYLDYNLFRKVEKNEPGGRVKIRTPRGYLRRTFAGLDGIQAKKVLTRLKAMGWDDEVVKESVVGFMSNKLKKEIGYETEDK
jgi:hypothetical protein